MGAGGAGKPAFPGLEVADGWVGPFFFSPESGEAVRSWHRVPEERWTRLQRDES